MGDLREHWLGDWKASIAVWLPGRTHPDERGWNLSAQPAAYLHQRRQLIHEQQRSRLCNRKRGRIRARKRTAEPRRTEHAVSLSAGQLEGDADVAGEPRRALGSLLSAAQQVQGSGGFQHGRVPGRQTEQRLLQFASGNYLSRRSRI